jgi:hypothetical protein
LALHSEAPNEEQANCCTYLLPIRRVAFSGHEAAKFRRYFEGLQAANCEVIVVDGSPDEVFAAHAEAWKFVAHHERVDRSHGYKNDKVNGIHTGVALAGCEKIILADDDIRYTRADVEQMCALLNEHEMVRPQNYLSPLPWWARMESARMLINRATLRTGDYPGTCGFRRSAMLRVGHYDGDVLFDNEEIIRHFAAEGADVHYALDFFVQKKPPTLRKWKEQRPRQAYEDFGLRTKTALFLALPLLLLTRVSIALPAVSAAAILLAFVGVSRGDAAKHVPRWICLYAPLWVLERTFSTYWAVWWRLRYGGYPFGDRLLTKGIGRDWKTGGRIAAQAAAEQKP